jgi:hypothetical protein
MYKISNFIDVLNQVSTENSLYISEKEGKFTPISKKSQKTLNTQKINSLAKKYLDEIGQAQDLDLCNKLGKALENYNKRCLISKSKSWRKRVLSWLGFKSKEEKEADFISTQLFTLAENIQKFEINQLVLKTWKKTKEKILTPKKQLILYNFKVLDSIPFNIFNIYDFMQGVKTPGALTDLESLASIIEDLTDFLEKVDSSSQLIVQTLINEMNQAFRLRTLVDNDWDILFRKKFNEPLQDRQKPLIKSIVNEILDKLNDLVLGSQIPIIISGGYSQDLNTVDLNDPSTFIIGGHHVLYLINEEKDYTFTFTLLNTGEDPQLNNKETIVEIKKKEAEIQKLELKITTLKNVRGDLINQEKSFVNLTKQRDQLKKDVEELVEELFDKVGKYSEIKYTHLSRWELSKDFFTKLLMFQISGAKDMETINNFLQAQLYNSQSPNKRFGRSYYRQNKNSCTIIPWFKLLHEKLGPLHQQFKVFVTEKELRRLETLSSHPDIHPIEGGDEKTLLLKGPELIAFMQTEGRKILTKRKRKLPL